MPARQPLSPRGGAAWGDPRHALAGPAARGRFRVPVPALRAGLVTLLLAAFPVILSAQSRATLQVAAQVVDIRPSRAALAAARQAADSLPGHREAGLATIRVEPLPPVDSTAHAARRVTISFLRN